MSSLIGGKEKTKGEESALTEQWCHREITGRPRTDIKIINDTDGGTKTAQSNNKCYNILLTTLFSNSLRCSSFMVRGQVSHPYKTGDKIIVLYVLILYVGDMGIKNSELHGSMYSMNLPLRFSQLLC
jgi:hypothetical protein